MATNSGFAGANYRQPSAGNQYPDKSTVAPGYVRNFDDRPWLAPKDYGNAPLYQLPDYAAYGQSLANPTSAQTVYNLNPGMPYRPDQYNPNNDPEWLARMGAGAAGSQGTLADFLSQFQDSGGGGGYNLSGEMGSIGQAYQTRLDELNRQRDVGGAQITAAQKMGAEGISKKMAESAASQTTTNDAIKASYANALQQSRDRGAAMAAELQKLGVDPSRLMAGQAVDQSGLERAGLAQGNYSQRMGQIANDSMSSRQQSLDLISAGAQGQLTNNYSQTVMRMDLQRQQQEAAARQQAAASAGKPKSAIEQATEALKLQALYNDVNKAPGSTDSSKYDLSQFERTSPEYAAAISGGDPSAYLRKYYTTSQPVYDSYDNKTGEGVGDPQTDAQGNVIYSPRLDQQGFDSSMFTLAEGLRSGDANRSQGDTDANTVDWYRQQVNDITVDARASGRTPDYSSIPSQYRPKMPLNNMTFNGRP